MDTIIFIAVLTVLAVITCVCKDNKYQYNEHFVSDKSSATLAQNCSHYTNPSVACPNDSSPVYWPLRPHPGQSNLYDTDTVDKNCNTLFTAHPNRLILADSYDQQMKHARLNKAGGVMYISYNKPTESPTCKVVSCPSNVNFPYPPNRPDLLTCWQC